MYLVQACVLHPLASSGGFWVWHREGSIILDRGFNDSRQLTILHISPSIPVFPLQTAVHSSQPHGCHWAPATQAWVLQAVVSAIFGVVQSVGLPVLQLTVRLIIPPPQGLSQVLQADPCQNAPAPGHGTLLQLVEIESGLGFAEHLLSATTTVPTEETHACCGYCLPPPQLLSQGVVEKLAQAYVGHACTLHFWLSGIGCWKLHCDLSTT